MHNWSPDGWVHDFPPSQAEWNATKLHIFQFFGIILTAVTAGLAAFQQHLWVPVVLCLAGPIRGELQL